MSIIMHVTPGGVAIGVWRGKPEVLLSTKERSVVPFIRVPTREIVLGNRIVRAACENAKTKRIGHVSPLRLTHNKEY